MLQPSQQRNLSPSLTGTLCYVSLQSYEGRSVAEWDRARVIRSGLCGLLAHGPLSHYYYLALDSWFAHMPVSTWVLERGGRGAGRVGKLYIIANASQSCQFPSALVSRQHCYLPDYQPQTTELQAVPCISLLR